MELGSLIIEWLAKIPTPKFDEHVPHPQKKSREKGKFQIYHDKIQTFFTTNLTLFG